MNVLLNKCYEQRMYWYSVVFNLGVLAVFVLVAGSILWYCYSHRLTPEEKNRKMRRDQEYILTKIREYQHHKNTQKEQMSQLIQRVAPFNEQTTSLYQEDRDAPSQHPLNERSHTQHVDSMYSQIVENNRYQIY